MNGQILLQVSREPSLDLSPAATEPDLTPLVALLSWRLAGFVDEDKYNMYETRKHSRTYGIVCLKDSQAVLLCCMHTHQQEWPEQAGVASDTCFFGPKRMTAQVVCLAKCYFIS